MKVLLISLSLLLSSATSFAIDCNGALERVFHREDLSELVQKSLSSKELSSEERSVLLDLLNPYTRTNIGGSLNTISDVQYAQMLKKISKGEALNSTERKILEDLDIEKAHKVYEDLLYSPKIHPFIRGRSSPRAYSNVPVSREKIEQIFESARWGASAFNEQPWRYIYATKAQPEKYNQLRALLDPWNQAWSEEAPVLAVAVRKKTFTYNGSENPFSLHDMGMAQANIGFEAGRHGVSVHPMGGFDAVKAKEVLGIPDDFEPMTMMTMGYRGTVKNLPQDMIAGEMKARERKPLEELVFKGSWGKKQSFKAPFQQKWKLEDFSTKAAKVDDNGTSISEIVKNRSSKRAFSNEKVSEEQIGQLLEAARWAPSAFNEQPWRFIYITKDHPDYEKFAQIVNEFNAPWAKQAHVLILGVGKKKFDLNGNLNPYFLHDLGNAQGNIQLQAEALGLNARQMGGIHPDKAQELLGIPEDYQAVSVIAVGHKGDPEKLPEGLRGEDISPRTRKEIKDLVFEGSWGH